MQQSAKKESDAAVFVRQLRDTSSDFADALDHIILAFGGKFNSALKAMHDQHTSDAVGILDSIRNSPVVIGIAGRLVSLREKVSDIQTMVHERCAKAGPLGEIVAGLTIVGTTVLAAGPIEAATSTLLAAIIVTSLVLAGLYLIFVGGRGVANQIAEARSN